MKKINFIGILIILFVVPTVNAQQTDAGVTPDSFLWGLDKAIDQLNLLLTFDKGEKAKKGIEIARERLLEVKAMVEENKLEAAEKAKEEHGKTLVKVKQNVKEIEKDNSTEEIKEVIEIEKELEEHDEEVEEVNTELKVKIKIEGTITDEQRALINSLLDSLKGQTGEVEIEIKNKKDKTKIKIKQETGKSDKEIEEEVEDIEQEKGLAELKKEKAAEEIEDAKEELAELEEELQESNITNKTQIINLISNAKVRLSNAEEAFKENDFGEAFGQANAAKQLIENAERILEKIVGKFEEEEEEREIEVEIEDGKANVKVEINDEKLKFTLETTDKNVIVQEIALRTGLSVDEVNKLAQFEEEKIEKKREVKEETKEEIEVEEEKGVAEEEKSKDNEED